MNDILERVKKDSLTIRGGEFANWYEGLSPVEKDAYNKILRK